MSYPGQLVPFFVLALLAAGSLAGCTPKIGDDCATSTDCSPQGDRLCDTTQPDGYCTIFNCEPDTCPVDEASCVAFRNELDPACGAADDGKWARFERSFCMARCEDDEDCRSAYECVAPSSRDAAIVDVDRSFKVCLVKSTPVASTSEPIPPACFPADAGAPPPPYDPASSTSAGAGGATGAGGAGGVGGAGGAGGAG